MKKKEVYQMKRNHLGGGLLSKKNPEGLEKFNKDKKSKRIIIGSLIGIVLLLGVLTLYKTFALYEEEKTFNVLKGKIPDFRDNLEGDIILSAFINGSYSDTIPSKTDGYYPKSVECTNNASGNWNLSNWNITISNLNKSGTTCNINFIKETKKVVIYSYISSAKNATLSITNYINDNSVSSHTQDYHDGTYTDYFNILYTNFTGNNNKWNITLKQKAYVDGVLRDAGYTVSWYFTESKTVTIVLAN